ncbi:hypothetical protein GUJ93_ZPchr0019g2680 [Zizania palustris]|uniref:Uncharacterized protein n=1 Tax=Zizania palustris TaxID=103762 RepID=A0A8J5TEG0_ZIZPA|nr:hypothetical protein GUJ93_ZPchr0019g2680 [Zizania palustris]
MWLHSALAHSFSGSGSSRSTSPILSSPRKLRLSPAAPLFSSIPGEALVQRAPLISSQSHPDATSPARTAPELLAPSQSPPPPAGALLPSPSLTSRITKNAPK